MEKSSFTLSSDTTHIFQLSSLSSTMSRAVNVLGLCDSPREKQRAYVLYFQMEKKWRS